MCSAYPILPIPPAGFPDLCRFSPRRSLPEREMSKHLSEACVMRIGWSVVWSVLVVSPSGQSQSSPCAPCVCRARAVQRVRGVGCVEGWGVWVCVERCGVWGVWVCVERAELNDQVSWGNSPSPGTAQ
ncbi:hypothetical protein RRG08_019503 [Elysia crispata]|uniref:Uncharacterized protein n=1 Tax=Elysia crispata TaxID=231223 RepID=A0AAE1E6H1_9GAST|nr:hypothetical protein RRG08_019503 [Elysia crispata]